MKKLLLRIVVLAAILLGACYWLGFYPFEKTLTGDTVVHHEIVEDIRETIYDLRYGLTNAVPLMKRAVEETVYEVRESIRELKEDARELIYDVTH